MLLRNVLVCFMVLGLAIFPCILSRRDLTTNDGPYVTVPACGPGGTTCLLETKNGNNPKSDCNGEGESGVCLKCNNGQGVSGKCECDTAAGYAPNPDGKGCICDTAAGYAPNPDGKGCICNFLINDASVFDVFSATMGTIQADRKHNCDFDSFLKGNGDQTCELGDGEDSVNDPGSVDVRWVNGNFEPNERYYLYYSTGNLPDKFEVFLGCRRLTSDDYTPEAAKDFQLNTYSSAISNCDCCETEDGCENGNCAVAPGYVSFEYPSDAPKVYVKTTFSECSATGWAWRMCDEDTKDDCIPTSTVGR
ncbi:hypothetical protein PSENEW3_00005770 [Picochlorum sp. SENEW3]|nr:hypothetical protein PSENEW3_00005770 [Picochlorum sp. SENEW3]